MRASWLAALVPALLALAPATARADEGDAGDPIEPAAGYSYSWEGSRITPARVLSSARLRKRDGMILLGIGSLAMTVGAGLMIGEAAVMPRPGEVRVWSKTGCWISFDFGLVLLPLGLHAAIAGIAMLARGRSHDRLAAIMSLEGPGPVWLEWHSTGKATRILGTVMTLVGSVFLSASLAMVVPHYTCDRWECNAWPEVGEWNEDHDVPWMLSLGFGAAAAVASTLGIIMLVAGFHEQSRFLENRHLHEVSLAPTPTGLALVW